MGLFKRLIFGSDDNDRNASGYHPAPDKDGLIYSYTPEDTIYVSETDRHQAKIMEIGADETRLRIVKSKDAKLPSKNWHTPNNPYALVNSRNELMGTLSEDRLSSSGYSVGEYAKVKIRFPRDEHEEYSLGIVARSKPDKKKSST